MKLSLHLTEDTFIAWVNDIAGQALRDAHNTGIAVCAYRRSVIPEQMVLSDQMPGLLPSLQTEDAVAEVKNSHRLRHGPYD